MTEHPSRPNKPKPHSKAKLVFVIIVVLSGGAGAFIFSHDIKSLIATKFRPSSTEMKQQHILPEKQSVANDATVAPENQSVPPKGREPAPQSPLEMDIEPGQEELTTSTSLPEPTIPQTECEKLEEDLLHFFQSLDKELYIEQFGLQTTTQEHFSELTETLLRNPPVVTRETDDLYKVLTNMAHFFRTIGKENILLIKGILDRERDTIEDVAQNLYKWTMVEKCSSDEFQLQASVEQVYEYAGFFVNTMGGRSYLFRRDSRSRLLINYYALLVIDKASDVGINHHGINIAELLPLLIDKIESSNQLIYKEMYLDTLYKLEEKYE